MNRPMAMVVLDGATFAELEALAAKHYPGKGPHDMISLAIARFLKQHQEGQEQAASAPGKPRPRTGSMRHG